MHALCPKNTLLSFIYQIAITLPITTATTERSFSVMKLIKNYLRNSMSDQRLTSLAIISIHKKRLEETTGMHLEKVVKEFLNMQPRRVKEKNKIK